MRENKFIAWNKVEKKMGEVRILDFICQMVQVKIGKLFAMWEFKDIELLQFTGVKDKNGVDIYEGDIITYQYMFADNKSTFEVKWNINRSGFYVGNEDGYFCLEKDLKNQFEVIGNIYENPELLEVKQ